MEMERKARGRSTAHEALVELLREQRAADPLAGPAPTPDEWAVHMSMVAERAAIASDDDMDLCAYGEDSGNTEEAEEEPASTPRQASSGAARVQRERPASGPARSLLFYALAGFDVVVVVVLLAVGVSVVTTTVMAALVGAAAVGLALAGPWGLGGNGRRAPDRSALTPDALQQR
ncbi:hypothetical protein ABZ446_06445 [Streptomyces sp. NPDC005813]|uniref:hypothetical protein n=1 Tax=Streptomyces sp. NPDC005813 TaxID=3155592 RepID=UPI0033F1968B